MKFVITQSFSHFGEQIEFCEPSIVELDSFELAIEFCKRFILFGETEFVESDKKQMTASFIVKKRARYEGVIFNLKPHIDMATIKIQDIVAKMNGEPETELDPNSEIRFEFGRITFVVSMPEQRPENAHADGNFPRSLKIRKIDTLTGDEQIKIMPTATNQIELL